MEKKENANQAASVRAARAHITVATASRYNIALILKLERGKNGDHSSARNNSLPDP
jgi:hypothetical protein